MNYPLALKNGTILADDYRIEGILGAGGSGITYVAKEMSLNREIAIKEYFPSDFAMRDGETQVCAKTHSDEEDYVWGLDRFIEEAQTLAKFDHSNIVRVFRYFQTHNTAYMVLKFEEGQNFKTWLEELGRTPSQAELDVILTPLLDALQLIHKDDFLHRDIAPDNIIIRRNGSPVLIDFGSARRVISNRPKTVSALIKPGYSPFEQYAMTGKDQGPWTDIYSLAATLYHAVTGKRPVDSPTRMVSDELVPAVKAAKPGFRKSFLQAIDAALKLKTRNRPQTIEEWREKLFAVTASPVAKKSQPAKSKAGKIAKENIKEEKSTASGKKAPTRKTPKKASSGEASSKPAAKKRKSPQSSDKTEQEEAKTAPIPQRPRQQVKRSIIQKLTREARRRVIVFLAEHARSDLNEKRDDEEGLVTRLSNLNLFPENEKSLEEQMEERQGATRSPYADERPEKTSKKKNNIIKKILSMPTEAEQAEQQKKKPPAAPNKSFEPIGPTQKPAEQESNNPQQDNLVTVKLKRKKIEVEPGPTTAARAKLLEQRKQEKTQKTKRRISRLSIAMRSMQLLLIIAIVTPFIYFLNLENENLTTGSTSPNNIAHILRGHLAPVTALAFTEDGDHLVTAGHDNNIRIWDSYSGKQTKLLNAHRSDVTALDVNNSQILSSDTNGEMILWDRQTGKALKNFKGHKSAITTVHLDNNAKKIISATSDNELKIWNTANIRKEQLRIRPHKTKLQAIAYAGSRKLLASIGDENVIRLWSLKTGRLRSAFYIGRREKPQAIALSKNGKRLAVSGPGFLKVWSTNPKRLFRSIRLDKKDITALAFSPNGRLLAIANEDQTIHIWNWRSRKIVRTLAGHTGRILNLTFSPDSRRIASASVDHTVRLWVVPVNSVSRK